MIFVLLFFLLCLSLLYGFGIIPGTGPYARKELGVSQLSLKSLNKSCDKIKKFNGSEKKYFTLGGMKSIGELLSSDENEKIEAIWRVCKRMDEGTIVTFDAFKDEVQGYDTVECEKFKTTMNDYLSKSIIHDGKLISHIDAYEKIYPKSFGRCYEK
jgi:hypothetical protein